MTSKVPSNWLLLKVKGGGHNAIGVFSFYGEGDKEHPDGQKEIPIGRTRSSGGGLTCPCAPQIPGIPLIRVPSKRLRASKTANRSPSSSSDYNSHLTFRR